ncbi:MAG: hypothetical protein J5I90_03575 [Caldilineales bacterium]|nr:hypothetical protein [Caldilineales bacterium]
MTETREQKAKKKHLYWIGFVVLIGLILLEIFDVGAAYFFNGSITILFVLALINAALIVNNYMHIGDLFSDGEDH